MKARYICVLILVLFVQGCVSPPSNPHNLCSIFDEKTRWFGSWYEDAKKSETRWGSPIPVMMAIMYQESRFVDDARPRRVRFLGVPLWWRISSSYGYSQAKTDTWRWYERSVGRNADRDDFDDAIDFIGWYNRQSYEQNGISLSDTYSLYLAYHEGHAGYRAESYKNKDWLIDVAASVRDRANTYNQQLSSCK